MAAAYRKSLERLIDEMQRSTVWWLCAAYRKSEARITQDAMPGTGGGTSDAPSETPSSRLTWAMRRLQAYWLRRWKETAGSVARKFVRSAQRHTLGAYAEAFKAAGMTVKMDPGRVMNDTAQALIAENVSLIQSIPRNYFEEVTGLVQRSVSMGRDVAFLEREIARRNLTTRNRAKFIARDQNNKACEAIKRAENRRLGITEGVWVHVPGSMSSRKSHMDMNGKRFKLDEGLYDSAVKRKVLPGELCNCNCTYRSVIPAFDDAPAEPAEPDVKKPPVPNQRKKKSQPDQDVTRPALGKTYAEIADDIKTRCGHFATNNGIRSVDIAKYRRGFMSTDANGKIFVNTKTWSLPNGKTFNAAEELKSAWNKLAEGKPLTWDEEQACEALWHKIIHNRQKPGSLPNSPKSPVRRCMELVTEWTARRTYHQMLEELGRKAVHQADIRENGYGYNRWVRNFDRLIEALKIDEEELLSVMLDMIATKPRNKYLEALVDVFSEKPGIKRGAIRKAFSKINNSERAYDQFLQTLAVT